MLVKACGGLTGGGLAFFGPVLRLLGALPTSPGSSSLLALLLAAIAVSVTCGLWQQPTRL